jgi:hypothetical protein
MTSSQEPPLTRREARERERLLQEQQAQAASDAASAPTPAPAAPASPPAASPPAPATPVQPAPTPAYPAPRPAGGSDDRSSPFGGGLPQPAPQSWPQPPAPSTTPERTLTRRELRAMLEGQPDEFDDLDVEPEPMRPGPAAALSASGFPAPAPETLAGPRTGDPAGATSVPFPPQPAPTRAPTPHQVAESAIADEPAAAPKPVGHWTAQLNAPAERAEPFDQLLSRGGVSHGVPTTTNALIMPNLPDHGPMGSGMKSGEVIVTGSIDLPRSYGATGVHPSQIDSSDVDRLFDQVEDGAGVGAPVSATRAISTQSASRAMMAPPKKEGMNVPLVLAVTAGVLALGVVATLVIGAVAGLF